MAFTKDEKYSPGHKRFSKRRSVHDVAAQKGIKRIQVGEWPWGIYDCATRPPTMEPRKTMTAINRNHASLAQPDSVSTGASLRICRRCRSKASAIPMACDARSSSQLSPSSLRVSRRCSASNGAGKSQMFSLITRLSHPDRAHRPFSGPTSARAERGAAAAWRGVQPRTHRSRTFSVHAELLYTQRCTAFARRAPAAQPACY